MAKPQKFCFAEVSDDNLVLSFNEARNVTLTFEEAAKLIKRMLELCGPKALIWTQLTKVGTGKDTIGPPPKGVGIAQCKLPFADDDQVTLNLVSLEGSVVAHRVCNNGYDRDQITKLAKSFL